MWRTILIYGGLLCVAAPGLQWIEFQLLVRAHPGDLYMCLLAAGFLALGFWVGMRLMPRQPAGEGFVPNEHVRGTLRISDREFQALELLANLLSGEPGEAEINQLGALLRGWGELCLSHAPGRAQEHFERAWACGPDPALAQQLANLYARQGMASGAHALAVPQPDLPPWPQPSCAGLHCQP